MRKRILKELGLHHLPFPPDEINITCEKGSCFWTLEFRYKNKEPVRAALTSRELIHYLMEVIL